MTSCSSSASVPKSTKSEDHRSKSCDTVCTSNSSCYLKRRKPANPLMYPVRQSYSKSTGNSVRQRVLSAKLLKLRSIQSQLNDANYHLSELSKENQILKTLQKRQDKALSKYENTNADLPRLIHSHEEQIRFLSEKNKSQRKTIKELNDLLKVKEEELAKTHEKLCHLEKLNRDKRLLDRERMLDQIEELKLKLEKSDDQNSILSRKLILESKTSKQRMNAEMAKHKQCQKELDRALSEIDRLSALLETKENVVHPRKNRFSRLGQQSISMVTLGAYHPIRTLSTEKLGTIEDVSESVTSKTPVTDIKLEPIKFKMEETKKPNGILAIPSENIKNRLSGASVRTKSEGSGDSNFSEGGSEVSLNNFEGSTDSSEKSRPDSGVTIGKLTDGLDSAIQKATKNTTDQFDKKLGDFCSDIMENVRTCSERIESQKEALQMYKDDTNTLLETFKKTQKIESKLKDSLFSFDRDSGVDFINDILSEELKFQVNTDKNEKVKKKEPRVHLEDRKKLLATLKAIDNGDGLDTLNDSPTHVAAGIAQVLSSGAK
nr:coiled-coil domain-containing protein 18 [Leptinotarsa decemlineata]